MPSLYVGRLPSVRSVNLFFVNVFKNSGKINTIHPCKLWTGLSVVVNIYLFRHSWHIACSIHSWNTRLQPLFINELRIILVKRIFWCNMMHSNWKYPISWEQFNYHNFNFYINFKSTVFICKGIFREVTKRILILSVKKLELVLFIRF